MSSRYQQGCEEHPPAEAAALNAGRSCGDQPVLPKAVPAHLPVVYPQPAHLGAGTPMRLEAVMVAPPVDGLTCGVTHVPALAPSQQQTVSHVLLPVVGSPQWQGWVMQPETTWITQSAIAPQQQSGLCHPSQALCCQHPGQLGSLYPGADGNLGRTPKSQEETQRALKNQREPSSSTENIGIAPESVTLDDNKLEQRSSAQGNNQANLRPDFAEILNKAMTNTSSKLMALLEEELNRMDDNEDDESSILEEEEMDAFEDTELATGVSGDDDKLQIDDRQSGLE
ncbi:hypothetical protein QBC45DRAFT_335297 [Copromyces sp. CBS 386.78]|nr:hypothetical protein QBC45DRAFT_335297 [Copromyces sp. CBS 386.78]